MIAADKIEQIIDRFQYLEAKMADGSAGNEIATLGKEYSDLRPVVETVTAYKDLLAQIADAKAMLADPEMKELAEMELPELRAALEASEHDVQLALLPKDSADARPALLEIRPGTGGDEAGLFAADLLRMYQRYAEGQGWRFEILEQSLSELGGVKEVVARIVGDGVFAKLKYESGVHRVQRVPETESQGRIHTSAAGVLILPEAEEVDVELNMNDVRVDVYRSSGPGGQSVNTTDSAVRLTHVPTGIVVSCQNEKSQLQNKESALRILRARLLADAQEKAEAIASAERKSQVRTVDRSERIRTYNFPENRISDHRVNYKANNLDAVLNGDLDDMIQTLLDADKAARLANAN